MKPSLPKHAATLQKTILALLWIALLIVVFSFKAPCHELNEKTLKAFIENPMIQSFRQLRHTCRDTTLVSVWQLTNVADRSYKVQVVQTPNTRKMREIISQ